MAMHCSRTVRRVSVLSQHLCLTIRRRGRNGRGVTCTQHDLPGQERAAVSRESSQNVTLPCHAVLLTRGRSQGDRLPKSTMLSPTSHHLSIIYFSDLVSK